MRSGHKQFELGRVTVVVVTLKGEQHLEDWAPEDAHQALDYASETACCSDVAKVEFRHGSKRRVFKNPHMTN